MLRRNMSGRFYDPDEIEPFEEGKEYTNEQLEIYADELLREDRRENRGHGKECTCEYCGSRVLFYEQTDKLRKREVPVDATEIDGTLTQIMQDSSKPGVTKGDNQKIFSRSHPKGRKVNTPEQRSRGSSFFGG